jgi:UPF0755 protein
MVPDEAPTTSRRNKGALVVVVVGVVMVMLAGFVAMKLLVHPDDYEGEGTGSVTVTVTRGERLSQIADSLAKADVVRSAAVFLAAAEGDDRANAIAPGTYTMRQQMSADAALTLMLDPASHLGSRVAVPEGLTVKETVALIARSTKITAASLVKALKRPDEIGLPEQANGNAEGYLFPATYEVAPTTTAVDLLSQMTRRFAKAARDVDLVARSVDLGVDPADVVTVASIVQREVGPSDYAKAARVIYNRLDKGLKLQLDSTVAYALGVRELKLTAAQLATKSPYNTYRVKGLPPGPVCNPGQAALEAALTPAAGDWLYFVTTDPKAGTTEFATTYEQFLVLKKRLQAATGG